MCLQKSNDYLVIQPPAFLDILGLFSRKLSVHSPCVVRTFQLPCHCPFETMACFYVTWRYITTNLFENGQQFVFQFLILNTVRNTHHFKTLWTFAQHCLSISPNLFDNKELACFTTLFSDLSWPNFWFNWRAWSRISSKASSV